MQLKVAARASTLPPHGRIPLKHTLIAAAAALCLAPYPLAAQTPAEKESFVRNAAVLLGSQQLCGYTVNAEILATTFRLYQLDPLDIEPGGTYSELFERTKKHIAAATDTKQGLKDYCANVQDKLGSLLLQ